MRSGWTCVCQARYVERHDVSKDKVKLTYSTRLLVGLGGKAWKNANASFAVMETIEQVFSSHKVFIVVEAEMATEITPGAI